MALRIGLSFSRSFVVGLRNYSGSTKHFNVSKTSNGFAMVTMNNPPVNSLSLEFLTEFSSVLDNLEKEQPMGMILTSASDKVFCAGLDILEMYKPKEDRVRTFWRTLQDVWIKLYGCSFPTAAVVNGHSPAGGCLLAMSCEYRVMLKNFTIGLNETQLGICAPPWFTATMMNTVGHRHTELALMRGHLYKTDEALKIGMIDEVAENKNEAVAQAEKYLQQYEMIPPLARQTTKKYLRGSAIEALENNREEDIKIFTSFIAKPEIQQGLEFYLAMLKNKSKAKQ